MTSGEPFRLLEWDTAFFGHRIACADRSRPARSDVDRAQEWMRKEGVDCLYWRVDPESPASLRAMEDAGFLLVDIRLTMERRVQPSVEHPPSEGDLVQASDLPALRRIARDSHGATRFYQDPHFSRTRCADLYETWIEGACKGGAEAVLVAREGAQPLGYLTCEIPEPGVGSIGLMAVAEEARGRRLGSWLGETALRWFAARGCGRVTVVSQGRNVPAVDLYESLGFETTGVEHYYHGWRSPESEAIRDLDSR